MSRKTYGILAGLERQAGGTLTFRPDGMVEGAITFVFDWTASNALAYGNLGGRHPDYESVFLHSATVERMKSGKGRVTYECIGLVKDPTPRVWQICPQVSTTAIQAHPKFVSDLAGTGAAPLNGATFDPDSDGNQSAASPFNAFTSGPLLGTDSFYDGGVIIRSSFYTRKPPSFSKAFKLTRNPVNSPRVAGVSNWLYMPPDVQQVPSTDFFKVTEEFLGINDGGLEAAQLLYSDD